MSSFEEKREMRKIIERYHLKDKATIIQPLLDKYGPDVLHKIEEERGKMMQEIWRQIGKKANNNSIDSLIANLWSKELFDYTFTTDEDGKTKMNVTWCLFADIAKELNIQKLAFHLYCVDDTHIVNGFNPDIEFTRTKTLMQGDDCCDHCYKLRKKE